MSGIDHSRSPPLTAPGDTPGRRQHPLQPRRTSQQPPDAIPGRPAEVRRVRRRRPRGAPRPCGASTISSRRGRARARAATRCWSSTTSGACCPRAPPGHGRAPRPRSRSIRASSATRTTLVEVDDTEQVMQVEHDGGRVLRLELVVIGEHYGSQFRRRAQNGPELRIGRSECLPNDPLVLVDSSDRMRASECRGRVPPGRCSSTSLAAGRFGARTRVRRHRHWLESTLLRGMPARPRSRAGIQKSKSASGRSPRE